MKVIEPSYEILEYPGNGLDISNYALHQIEQAGRVCYKSEGRVTGESAPGFVKNILERGHESVIEHASMTVKFVCDRGVSHELVRHRLCAFSMESTRYCNYSKGKFGGELTFIKPLFWDERTAKFEHWLQTMDALERTYLKLIELGAKPEEARSVLPNSLKTEIVVTANLREWRHIFKLRTSLKAHPQMRQLVRPLLRELKKLIPIVFDDIDVEFA